MDGRRISEYYEVVGQEYNYRGFFGSDIPLVTEGEETVKAIIDSTGLPNDVHMPITAVSNHNRDINNEVRLIIVMDRDRWMPIFARYVPGNIVNSSTLIQTMRELEQQGVRCAYALMDVGYPTESNIRNLYESNVSFMSRLDCGSNLYKGLREEALPGIACRENFTMFEEGETVRQEGRVRLGQELPRLCVLHTRCRQEKPGGRQTGEEGRKKRPHPRRGLRQHVRDENLCDHIEYEAGKLRDPTGHYVRQRVGQLLDIG